MKEIPEEPSLAAGLYLVGTPIGNMEDLTLRALRVLKSCDAIYCEDTRQTRKLTDRYQISAPLVSCHGFNEASRREEVVSRIEQGQRLALVSDAGMPCISDPGSRLVAAVRGAQLPVTVIPGVSAVTQVVSWSGWGDEGFVFEGFLPNKSAGRRRVISTWRDETRGVVFFESVHRIQALLADLAELLPEREVFVGRELTKTFEEGVAGLPAGVVAHYQNAPVKGEFTCMLAPLSGAARREARKRVREGGE